MRAELAPGDPAPDFSLPTDVGGRTSLSDWRGRKVVLYFYPSDDTETCTAEAIAFNRLTAAFGVVHTIILGISPDSVASHVKFKRKHRLHLALAADEDRSVIEAYGVWREKTLFGRTYMGVERTTFLIDEEGRVAQVWRKVRVKGHAEAVLKAASA